VFTNIIGNSVATIVVANWEKALDRVKLRRELKAGFRPVETHLGHIEQASSGSAGN
jgi:aerobic C4-dicarboxylate transport protein